VTIHVSQKMIEVPTGGPAHPYLAGAAIAAATEALAEVLGAVYEHDAKGESADILTLKVEVSKHRQPDGPLGDILFSPPGFALLRASMETS
jgi:hypothetical protein